MEVQLRLELPDEAGRGAILRIHTRRMAEAGALAASALVRPVPEPLALNRTVALTQGPWPHPLACPCTEPNSAQHHELIPEPSNGGSL